MGKCTTNNSKTPAWTLIPHILGILVFPIATIVINYVQVVATMATMGQHSSLSLLQNFLVDVMKPTTITAIAIVFTITTIEY